MSGNQDLVDEKMKSAVSVLERMSQSLLIDNINVNPEAEKFLMLTEDVIEKMTPTELATGEYILSAYGLIVQRKLNRANAIKGWANKCIERIIAQRYSAFDGYMKYEIRRASIALDNEYAKRLSDIITEQEMITDDLTYLSQSINNLSNSLGNLARIRSKNYAYSTREN